MPRKGVVDHEIVGQRLVTLTAAAGLAAVAAAVASGAPGSLPNWAAPQISTVVAHGLMGAKSVRTFKPNSMVDRQTLADLTFGLEQELGPPPAPPAAPGSNSSSTGTTSTQTTTTTTTTTTSTTTTPTTTTPPSVSNPGAQVTMAELDRQLVAGLGLGKAAKQFAQGARAAGAAVPGRFGTEVVARLLGLRINHPAAQDFLELRPQDPATRAEAAYSAAQILGFGVLDDSWQIEDVQSLAASFTLPQLNDWQRQILNVALSKVGMPYIWGGTNDGPEVDFGVAARGGYDCSGFVWRVYKLQSYPNEGSLASTIMGRTTYSMSVEVPPSKRIPFAKLQPADVIFFGTNGPHSTGPQIFHTGIYVGNGWFVESSGEGVALAQLSGWNRKKFAWGRRPLKEAGLEP
jgi:cell wall-associated NlpC family hydrolase